MHGPTNVKCIVHLLVSTSSMELDPIQCAIFIPFVILLKSSASNILYTLYSIITQNVCNIYAVSIPGISLYKFYKNLKTSEYNRKIY
jgi:hypothetical protein